MISHKIVYKKCRDLLSNLSVDLTEDIGFTSFNMMSPWYFLDVLKSNFEKENYFHFKCTWWFLFFFILTTACLILLNAFAASMGILHVVIICLVLPGRL